MNDSSQLLSSAEQVVELLRSDGVESLLIGGLALAAYSFVRYTEDLDLAITVEPSRLRDLADLLISAGYCVELIEPDPDDPLGGVLNLGGPFGKIKIINFGGRFPAVIRDALAVVPTFIRPGSPLKIIPLPHLIALKLYSGGLKSKVEILELIRRNPDLDLSQVALLSQSYRLAGFDTIQAEVARATTAPAPKQFSPPKREIRKNDQNGKIIAREACREISASIKGLFPSTIGTDLFIVSSSFSTLGLPLVNSVHSV
jgi:hypothetical protein